MTAPWPDLGTRVTIRYRRPAGSVPPLTDAVGHLLAIAPTVRVQTKTGAIAEFAPADVVALRVLTDAPIRTAEIRALEHAAAAAWPGTDRSWLDGWLLRACHGAPLCANSAVPLDISARPDAIPAILDWYTQRGRTPRLAIPDRLMPDPAGLTGEHTERVLVGEVAARQADPSITVSPRPDDVWRGHCDHEIAEHALTAVIDGELAFGSGPQAVVARAAVTDAPDGTRWVGVSAACTIDDQSPTGPAALLYTALLAWGAGRGATRGYTCVPGTATPGWAESLGLRLHHRRRYLRTPASL
ncbi:hypothetical protein NJB1507_28010 [Mycobacterium marinum]|uniref:N-acetylglutamate synthase, CG3035 family n=1 Tax=Mycobacterium marinum TaxID=1781 RepID=UPI0021C40184|nr:GNAT family N-acetyltransferase [Mycobacterium marinum]GJO25050.1 hypothetical protein NJB1507_28010 [Mycobacterium marinum]